MKITVINDLHLGVQRSGGTTPESAAELRKFARESFQNLLLNAHDYVVINGDMFDTYSVPLADLLNAYEDTTEWLNERPNAQLVLIAGNHDLSKNSANIGSLQLLAFLLMDRYKGRVRLISGPDWVEESEGIYAISHVVNQEVFDLYLSRVPDNAKYLLLHCNFDNLFAGMSDHSLNIARATARDLTARGVTIILGHEHQCRTLLNDKVVIVGNQFPTSIADCLSVGDAQKDGMKYSLVIDGDDMELVPSWSANGAIGDFQEVDWRDIGNQPVEADFVRVSGKATSAEASEVIKVISKLRQRSGAFVITNAVKIDGVEGQDEIEASVEDIRAVNVIELLLQTLDPDQQAVVRKLLAEDVQ